MGQDIFIAGIACVVAAIVGGGVKLLGVEAPVINSLPRQILLALVGAMLIALNWPTPPPAPKIPVYVVWNYNLGSANDAPNDLRFWTKLNGTTWKETFPDGSTRNHFETEGSFHLDVNQCDGMTLRREDRSFLAFVPDNRCAEQELYYQDVNPASGAASNWKVLGRIVKATY
jgi:hypothetical protein